MSYKAIKSKNIFINDTLESINGYIIIKDEKIEDILTIEETEKKLLPLHCPIIDYENLYIFPGLIDTNVHLNSTYDEIWIDTENITKMAAQGGITSLIDNPILNNYTNFTELNVIDKRINSLKDSIFVDVGLLSFLDLNSINSIDELYSKGILGFRGYLSPCSQTNKIVLTKQILKQIQLKLKNFNKNIVFSFHCELANERDLYIPSPCRNIDKDNRLDMDYDIKNYDLFGGGHQGPVNEEIDSLNSSKEELNDEVMDLLIEETKNDGSDKDLISPTTADLKMKSLINARNEESKYIADQELLQYKHVEDNKESDDENIFIDHEENSDLKISENNDSINDNKQNEETDEEKQNSFKNNPLKPLFFSILSKNINSSTEIFAHQPLILPNKKIKTKEELLIHQNLDNNDEENSEHKKKSSSITSLEKKKGILERRLDLMNIEEEQMQNRKKAKSLGSKHPFQLNFIKTIKKDVKSQINLNEESKKSRYYKIFLQNHPIAWEESGINLLIKLFKTFPNCKIHITNLSSSSLAFSIRDQKKKNPDFPFYTDTSIPYIFFYADLIKEGQTEFKTSPPIRDKKEQELFIKSIKKGIFDTFSSFHMQVPIIYKNIDQGNFRRAFDGVSCIGFNLQTLWTKIYSIEKKRMKLKKNLNEFEKNKNKIFQLLIKLLSVNPAKIYNLSHKKGGLNIGNDADFFIWDPFCVHKIGKNDIYSKYPKNFVLKGLKVYGDIKVTYLRGEIIYSKDNEEQKYFYKKGKLLSPEK